MFPHKKTAGPAVAAERDRRQSGYSTTSAALRAAQPRQCLPPRGHSRDWDRSKGPTGVEPVSHPCPLPGVTPAVAWHTSNAGRFHWCRVSVAVCPLYYCRGRVRFWPKSGENSGILPAAYGILYGRPRNASTRMKSLARACGRAGKSFRPARRSSSAWESPRRSRMRSSFSRMILVITARLTPPIVFGSPDRCPSKKTTIRVEHPIDPLPIG